MKQNEYAEGAGELYKEAKEVFAGHAKKLTTDDEADPELAADMVALCKETKEVLAGKLKSLGQSGPAKAFKKGRG